MDVKELLEKILSFFKKYRYAVLILAIGLILMAIPGTDDNTQTKESSIDTDENIELTLEQKISSVLSQIEGAGDVQVILTIATGEQTVYQTNEDLTTDSASNRTSVDTVTITDGDRNQSGLICQVNPPVYQGAVIVCQGADDPTVQLAIVDAVSKLTGLGANRISVLKMK